MIYTDFRNLLILLEIYGLPGGDRTPDPQLRRLMLYPTELRADIRDKRLNGRGDPIRTSGLKSERQTMKINNLQGFCLSGV